MKNNLLSIDRRTLLGGLAAMTMSTTTVPFGNAADAPAAKYPVAMFGKVFKNHTYKQLAEILRIVDADGVEATIRRDGHIDPGRSGYGDEIRQMVSTLKQADKQILIAATDVNEASPASRELLTRLRDADVMFYRLGYYRYAGDLPLMDQLKRFADQAKALAALNEELGMVGIYQNHASGDQVGSLIWDLAILFDGISKEHLGVALDLRHLRVEISGSFETAIEAIGPHIRSVYLKDAKRIGPSPDDVVEVPLGEGMANAKLFQTVMRWVDPAPICVHVEYFGQDPIALGDDAAVIQANKTDIATARSWLA